MGFKSSESSSKTGFRANINRVVDSPLPAFDHPLLKLKPGRKP